MTRTHCHLAVVPLCLAFAGWSTAIGVTNEAYQAAPSLVELVGCPLCETGYCGFTTPELVLGPNDSRISHAGTEVVRMHEHPAVSATLDFPELPEPIVGTTETERPLRRLPEQTVGRRVCWERWVS